MRGLARIGGRGLDRDSHETRLIISETHNALPRLTFQHFLSVMSEGIKLKISLRLSCDNEIAMGHGKADLLDAINAEDISSEETLCASRQ